MVGIIAAAVIAVGFICFCGWFLSGAESTYYYAQIDNSKIERVDSRAKLITGNIKHFPNDKIVLTVSEFLEQHNLK